MYRRERRDTQTIQRTVAPHESDVRARRGGRQLQIGDQPHVNSRGGEPAAGDGDQMRDFVGSDRRFDQRLLGSLPRQRRGVSLISLHALAGRRTS